MLLNRSMLMAPANFTAWLWSAADKDNDITLSESNRVMTNTASGGSQGAAGSAPAITAGSKVYTEFAVRVLGGGGASVGGCSAGYSISLGADPGGDTHSIVYINGGQIRHNSAALATVSSYGTGDVIGWAHDTVSKRHWFSKNGVWQGGGAPGAFVGYLSTNACTRALGFVQVQNTALEIPISLHYQPPAGFGVL